MITTFDPKTHIATVNGEEWPSVTQLITENRLQDLTRVPEERLEYKRLLGQRVHSAASLLDKHELDEKHFEMSFPDCVPYLNAYKKFREIEGFEMLFDMTRLFSKTWRFHGEPDFVGTHTGKYAGHIVIIDYKCVFKMYESTGPQTAGYEMLIMENADGLQIPKELRKKKVLRFALILKPTGNYDLVPLDSALDKQHLQACIVLHWARRERYCTQKGVLQ